MRATASGLACPDWPSCYGKVIPRQRDIPAGSAYTLWNVWLEHSHRLVASLVGVLVVGLAAVILQGALGALVVLHLLKAGLVTAHLGMSLVVVASLLVLVLATSSDSRWRTPSDGAGRMARATVAVGILAFVQILVGGQVTGLYAALAYGTDPLRFNGDGVPPWPRTAAEAVHLAHRLLAVALAVAVVVLATALLRGHRAAQQDGRATTRSGRSCAMAVVLVTLVAVQVGLGAANLVLHTPPEIVTAHLAVASWIWTAAVILALLELVVPVERPRVAQRPPPMAVAGARGEPVRTAP